MRVLGVIPARAGSKRIPGKNTKKLDHIPLIEYTIAAAYQSNLDEVFVSTDIDYYFKRYPPFSKRPPELCQDDTPMIAVLQHITKGRPDNDAICLLQPTSPLRTSEDIDNAIALYDGRPVYSGYYMPLKTKDKPYCGEQHFQRNGAIFITPVELIKQGKLWDETVIEYEMPYERSIDIDTMSDWFIAEAILEKMRREA